VGSAGVGEALPVPEQAVAARHAVTSTQRRIALLRILPMREIICTSVRVGRRGPRHGGRLEEYARPRSLAHRSSKPGWCRDPNRSQSRERRDLPAV